MRLKMTTGKSCGTECGWRGLARVARSIMPVLAVCSLWALLVVLDVVVMRTRCLENSIVEWTQFLLVTSSGVLMAVMAARSPRARGAFAMASAFFFDMAIREMDGFLDELLWHGSWSVLAAAVTIAAFAVVFAFRWHGTVVDGLLEIGRSRSFPLLAVGLAVILLVSRIMGMKYLWASVGDLSRMSFPKRMVEESLELFGYGLVFLWSVIRVVGCGASGDDRCASAV